MGRGNCKSCYLPLELLVDLLGLESQPVDVFVIYTPLLSFHLQLLLFLLHFVPVLLLSRFVVIVLASSTAPLLEASASPTRVLKAPASTTRVLKAPAATTGCLKAATTTAGCLKAPTTTTSLRTASPIEFLYITLLEARLFSKLLRSVHSRVSLLGSLPF